ncbi:STN domain-containing protein, partial [Petrimonas sp.]|uniref:STN domain-containing protein n=1 Tax=Petrimonas sp. TaxID=2023866 RepID=UPI00331D1F9F
MLFFLPSFSQITVNVQNKTLRQALKEIEKVSNYRFFYNESLAILDKNSSIQLTNSSIDNAMQTLLAGTDVAYEKNNHIVVLVDKGTVALQPGETQQDKV